MKTRQEMLNEDADADTGESAKVADNLKYFLNPKELLTPITPKDPNENINVQALRSRRVDDDFEVVERVRADEVAQMLRGKGGEGAAKKLDERTVRVLREYLEPVRQ
ncbi:hypothetical protein FBU59_006249 [Linderina macrospora]|uniref:Uncharacterized protein n=1 Tax=Linderina macrospora TaxID=4868 RepID=A0ACC1J0I2_9FUNG|nr:hypothetical protein FBU59_006249 [Linderina macrospora]